VEGRTGTLLRDVEKGRRGVIVSAP
jgi:hypothetical protein